MRIIAHTNKPLKWKLPYGELVERPLGIPKFLNGDIDKNWLFDKTKEIADEQGNMTDIILFFVDDYGKKINLLGRAYGGFINGYKVGVVRADRYNTAEHELLHMFNDFVQLYLGYDLSSVFGVASFDENVVHGNHPNYREYEYKKVFEKAEPYVMNAVAKRKQEYISLLEELVVLYRQLIMLKKDKVVKESDENPILKEAKKWVGRDASPRDLAPDTLACAESVCSVLNLAGIKIPMITGTWSLWENLKKNCQMVTEPKAGDIIISPTGTGKFRNGHVGIVGENGVVYSNNSHTGLWDTYWNIGEWRDFYGREGGFPVYFYRYD